MNAFIYFFQIINTHKKYEIQVQTLRKVFHFLNSTKMLRFYAQTILKRVMNYQFKLEH